MFRLLYLVVLVAGLFWIVQSMPLWLDPQRAADMRPHAAGGPDWDEQEARDGETAHRVKIVVAAVIGVVVAGEAWAIVYHRLRWFRRT
jgi:hypothetical protein